MNPETSVINRYGNAAKNHEENLCCPVEYDTKYLKIIPDEIIEKDWFITKSCTCTCHESMLAVSSRTRNAKRWIFLYPYPRRFISLILLFVPSIFPFE